MISKTDCVMCFPKEIHLETFSSKHIYRMGYPTLYIEKLCRLHVTIQWYKFEKKKWKDENFWLRIFSPVQTILLWDFVNLSYPWPSEGCNFWTRCQIKNLRLQICPPWSIDTCRYPQSFHLASLEQYFCKKIKSLSWLRS